MIYFKADCGHLIPADVDLKTNSVTIHNPPDPKGSFHRFSRCIIVNQKGTMLYNKFWEAGQKTPELLPGDSLQVIFHGGIRL